MKYCEKCKVTVLGKHQVCPLCQKELELWEGTGIDTGTGINIDTNTSINTNTNININTDIDIDTEDLFPQLQKLYKRNLVFKVITFLSFLLIIISVFLNLMLPGKHGWAYIIIAAAGCFWITFYIAFRKRKNVEKAILYMEILISVLCLFWDYFTGYYGWALSFVIPGLGIVTLISLFIVSRCMHASDDDDMIYLILGSLLGLLPLLFYGLHWVHFSVPSLVCALASIIFLTAVLVFQGDRMMAEIQRRMHV